jgi:hypothetical protein
MRPEGVAELVGAHVVPAERDQHLGPRAVRNVSGFYRRAHGVRHLEGYDQPVSTPHFESVEIRFTRGMERGVERPRLQRVGDRDGSTGVRIAGDDRDMRACGEGEK